MKPKQYDYKTPNENKLKNELYELGQTIFNLYINPYYDNEKDINSFLNRGNIWVKKTKNKDLKGDDKLLIDLIDELTKEDSNIKNYDDLYNHKFFCQYIY